MRDLVLFSGDTLCLVGETFKVLPGEQVPMPAPGGTYDPTAHIPDGIILDCDTYHELMTFWAGVGGRVLTEDEIVAITGNALPVPSLKVEFGTGDYPPPDRWAA